MRICPKCRTVYTGVEKSCPKDGVHLMDAREHADAEADPLRGVTVAGRFKITDRIGVGGMGTVYRAEQQGLSRAIAVKILKRELVFDSDTVTRFHREAKAMSLLTHPNTVRVFDFGETDDGLLFLAMELLEGELITHKLEREGALDVKQAVGFIREILASLAEAHQKKIIHRDLKPDNIYLAHVEGRAEPVVKVLDFGIAKVIQGDRKLDQLETQAGTVFGTPRYMSPEQAQGKTLDGRSDLYAVGVLLFQLLTGRAPFVDDDAVVVMAKHIKEVPEPIRKVAPDRPIPGSLERVVMKALEKNPDKRFATADEMDARLAATIPEIEELVKSGKTGRRRGLRDAPRSALFAGGAVLLAAIALSAYLVASSGSARDTGDELVIEQVPHAPPTPAPVPVLLTSSPTGALVVADGIVIGSTPLAVPVPPAGMRRVVVRAAGFVDAIVDVLASGAPPTVTLAPNAPAIAQVDDTAGTVADDGHVTQPRRGGRGHGRPPPPSGNGQTVASPPPPPVVHDTHDTPPVDHHHHDPYERLD